MERQYSNFSSQEINHRYKFMEAAARTLGNYAVEMVQGEVVVRIKEDGSKVTNVDETLNQMLIDMVQHYFPHDLVWGEEGSIGDKGDLEAAAQRWVWIADPIDGTNKLWRAYEARDFSECNSTVLLSGFAPDTTTPTMSTVFSPFRQEQMLVSAGPYGAFVSTTEHAQPLVIEAGAEWSDEITRYEYSRWGDGLQGLPEVLSTAQRVKTPVRMASVALGMVDISAFPLEAHPHDVIAGAHIVHAAGGAVRSLTGRPFEAVDWRVDPVDGVMAGSSPEFVDRVLQQL